MESEAIVLADAVFRPAKRRKFTKTRPTPADEESPVPRDATESPDRSTQIVGLVVPDALRLRRTKAWRSGIVFSATAGRSSEPPAQSTQLATVDAQDEQMLSMFDRFAPHSGQVVDVNKHMVAYIESEMAKRRLGESMPRPWDTEADSSQPNNKAFHIPDKQTLQRQPAAIGKIHEIDLGQDTSLRNKERTELAIRRARGENIPVDLPAATKKPRLGRNGKPRRGPKPRDVEDVKRDQLVEQVLREARLEIYDEPESSTVSLQQREGKRQTNTTTTTTTNIIRTKDADNNNNNNDDDAKNNPTNPTNQDTTTTSSSDSEDFGTDDRVVAQFRHEFMEAMQERHRHRAALGQARQQARQARRVAAARESGQPLPPSQPSHHHHSQHQHQHHHQLQQQQSSSRGPKLGGSRSARAAMRAQMLQERMEKGGKK